MSKKETYAKAHSILDLLANAVPAHDGVRDAVGWRKKIRNDLRAEHWQMICDELETGASPEAIIASLSAPAKPATPAPPVPPTFTATDREPATDFDRARARNRIAQIRQSLKENAS